MHPKIRYLLPSIAQFLFVVVFLHLSLNIGSSLLADCDTGFHIKAGEYILETRSIPKHDPFSLFSPPMPWPTHEWLSDVIMASIDKMYGLSGVVIFFIFIISVTYSLLFRVLRANKGNIIIDIILIVLVLTTSQVHWLARPHIFTLLLLAVWYFILDSFHNDRNNLLFLLPPIMLLWINLHGGFVLGFITIMVYLLHNFMKSRQAEGAEKEIHARKAKYLFLAMMASTFVSLVNPKGFHTLLFPFEMVSNRLIMDNCSEFLSPNFHYGPYVFFRYFLLIMIACFCVFTVRLNIIELALVLIFTNMSLFSVRHIPLFAMIVAPVLSKHGNATLNQLSNKVAGIFVVKSRAYESIDESAKGHVWPIAAIAAVAFLLASNKIVFRFDESQKPVAAVEFLKKEYFPGNMFNNDEFGDYIIYSAYPRYKVFIDGRSDIYGNDKLQDYLNIANMQPGWEKIFDKYSINWIIFNTGSALSQYLTLEKGWKLVYLDNVASIYVKNTRENEHIIKKYANQCNED